MPGERGFRLPERAALIRPTALRRAVRGGVAVVAATALAGAGLGLTMDTATGAPTTATMLATGTPAAGSTIGAFLDPQQPAKTMVRMWFPDAQAGDETNGYLDQVENQINDLADGGFGGVEIAYLSDRPAATNDDLDELGWGTKNWQRIVKTVLKTANAEDQKFQVDLTITAHWPPSVNNIDFNDDGASQEASQAYTKITADDLTAGSMDLPLPATKTKTKDNSGVPFVFTDTYDSSAIAKVTSVAEDGTPTLELASLADATGATSKRTATEEEVAEGNYIRKGGKNYAGSAAGVPDEATAEELGVDYDDDVVAYWGQDPASDDFDGKIDADGNRKRMADWQYDYTTDLSGLDALSDYTPSSGDDLAAGDYVLIGNYYRGTGQTQSGGSKYTTQYNRAAATNYFSKAGVQAIFDAWDDHILDPEMKKLLKANGGAIFEDSIEGSFSTKPWTKNVTEAVADKTGLDTGKYASALVGSAVSFDDTDAVDRIGEDYSETLGDLYETKHASLISDWASTFGYQYRAQAYTLDGLDIGAAAEAVDVPEGDNSSAGDGVRTLYGTLNMADKGDLLSMESVTATATKHSPWSQVLRLLNADASDGINRVILHGSSFSRSFDADYNAWPGWNFSEFLAMNGRQAWWDQVGDFTGYVNRMQAVLQSGTRKVDVAMLLGSEDGYSFTSGNAMQDVLDHGYSYNVLTEPIWSADGAEVTQVDGQPVLKADGPAYKALVLDAAETMSLDGIDRLQAYADAGLPIAVVDSDPSRVYGTDESGSEDFDLQAAFTKLLASDSVTTLDSLDEVTGFLTDHGVSADAQYDAKHLEASHIANTEGDYYYLYNDGMSVLNDASAGDTTLNLYDEAGDTEAGDTLTVGSGSTEETVTVASAEAAASGSSSCVRSDALSACPMVVTLDEPLKYDHKGLDVSGGTRQRGEVVSNFDSTSVTLKGSGTPYELDLSTGEVTPIAEYTTDGDSVSFDLDLGASESTVVALANDTTGFPQAGAVHAVASSGGSVSYDADGNLQLTATEPGDYTVDLSDGTTRTVKVGAVPDAVDLADGWDLGIESWGPDAEADAVNPTVSKKTDVSFGDVSLGSWLDTLSLSDEQKTALGVDGIDEVSGNATYTRSFTLPEDWDGSSTGVRLRLEHGYDNLTGLSVNGDQIDALNQFNDTVTIPADVLKAGENIISIDLSTSLDNRAGWTTGKQDQGVTEIGWSSTVTVPLEADAGTVSTPTLKVSPAKANGRNGWYTTKVKASVTGVSDATVQLKVGSGSWKRYTGPVTVSAQGTTMIRARAVSGSQVSATASAKVKIDTVRPKVKAKVTKPHTTPHRTRVVRLSGRDATSGIAKIRYRIGHHAWKVYRHAITVAKGTTVRVAAVDRAGNTSEATVKTR
ncbi:MAG: glycosyl hydrolase [Nocardioides sp.]|uniref:glycosyl hydrolase n=1 Tax=Nocardioides sp. TaxID=35761 RepID=UPI0039E53992